MEQNLPAKVAKIDNAFIMNAQYKLSAKEQKVLYYLISNLNPKEENAFHRVVAPIREIEETLKEKGKKWGGLYAEMERICEAMVSRKITFPSQFSIEGKRVRGHINWFQSIMPVEKDGQVCIEFLFSEPMTPFLLQLREYVRISTLEVATMKSGHAIRMFSIFKAEKDRMSAVRQSVTLAYQFEELKALLGIEDKYQADFKDFRKRVLDVVRDEINASNSSLFVEYRYLKTGRKVTGVEFTVKNKPATVVLINKDAKKGPAEKGAKSPKNAEPTDADLEPLTRAKLSAFWFLTERGVFGGIALNQILPSVRGSESDGFEDIFTEKAWAFFEKKARPGASREQLAATFVTWWLENKIFESGDVWAKLTEQVVAHKKRLEKTQPTAFQNRLLARTMPNAEFEAIVRAEMEARK